MPNTRVKFPSACLGGIMAGTIYQVVQWTYFKFQVLVTNYGAVYGSFAALPLFLVWLQTSWLIVLFGAEISFAEQNVETYEFEPDCFKISKAFKKTVTVNIVQVAVSNFVKAERPWTSDEYAHQMEVPIRLVRQIIFELTEANILSEVKLPNSEHVGYAPARDVEKLSIAEVLLLLDNKGENNVSLIETPQLKKIEASLQDFQKSNSRSPSNHLLKDL
jgi:membrane protein